MRWLAENICLPYPWICLFGLRLAATRTYSWTLNCKRVTPSCGDGNEPQFDFGTGVSSETPTVPFSLQTFTYFNHPLAQQHSLGHVYHNTLLFLHIHTTPITQTASSSRITRYNPAASAQLTFPIYAYHRIKTKHKMGFLSKKKDESDESTRNALFGNRKKDKASSAAANPYANPPADPYSNPPPAYSGGDDQYRRDKSPAVTAQGGAYGGGYGNQGGSYGGPAGYGSNRYETGPKPQRQGGYGGISKFYP